MLICKEIAHSELDLLLDRLSQYDKSEVYEQRQIADEIFGFLDILAGTIIEKELQKAGRATFKAKAFHLDETERAENWPLTESDKKAFRARVLIALINHHRTLLKNIDFPVEGVSRDLLGATSDHAYSPQYLPNYKRGRGKDDNDDRRIMARRKLVLGVYAKSGSTGQTIQNILMKYPYLTESTWKRMRKEVSSEIRNLVKTAGEDDFDYSGYDLSDNPDELYRLAVQLK